VEPYGERYTPRAIDGLTKLHRKDRKIYNRAESMIGLICSAPHRIGDRLKGELARYRAVPFWNDKYRIVWEVDDDLERVIIARVGPRGAQGTSIYAGLPEDNPD
jgi:mRNA-degrading endonuclease RelE of RelBE toxin-antitoxin system